jgi:hypothetical protein
MPSFLVYLLNNLNLPPFLDFPSWRKTFKTAAERSSLNEIRSSTTDMRFVSLDGAGN